MKIKDEELKGQTVHQFDATIAAWLAGALPVYSNEDRPPADEVSVGFTIWNTDDGAPNFSDGVRWVVMPGGSGGGYALTRSWTFQTNTAVGYAGGFYEFGASDDSFSPAITFGVANAAVAAHFFVVTGATTVDDVTIRVTGTAVDDDGNRVDPATADIVIPAGTPANTYIETPEKWNGQVSVETVGGTAIQCNYGWSKYHDVGNTDFILVGLEALWESDSTDASSDIELLHHRSTGWTFNAAAPPTPPPPLASRSADFAPEDEHRVGQGAWKRANLSTFINGADSEGVLFRITSGSTGIGSLSFRLLTLEISIASS